MPKRINWKKGMRLTDEVMKVADEYSSADLSQSIILSAAGRFGLFSSARPFQVSLNVTNSFVDVESLDCLAITKSGSIIDVKYDTRFEKAFETRIAIPDDDNEQEYLLIVCAVPGSWAESEEGYKETAYSFALLPKNAPLPDYAMPIGRIVRKEEWEEDKVNFIPPCLYVSSHRAFEELHAKFLDILRSINEKSKAQMNTGAKTAISIYWPIVQQIFISVNTLHDTMTPMHFLANVQKVVAAFTCACELDEVLQLEDAATFSQYALLPYNYQNVYLRIRQGLGMCYAISEKVDKFSLLQIEEPKPEPSKEKPQPEPIDPRRFWDGKCI